MFFFYDAADALFEFMQKGGDVLYLIGLLAFLMWFLIFERLWYFKFSHQTNVDGAVKDWSKRADKKNMEFQGNKRKVDFSNLHQD